jgi:hypothetical protein
LCGRLSKKGIDTAHKKLFQVMYPTFSPFNSFVPLICKVLTVIIKQIKGKETTKNRNYSIQRIETTKFKCKQVQM